MKIQTFSVVVGGKQCNAACPYCVSKMTGDEGLCDKGEDINFRNFRKACDFAQMSGVSTVLLTGKGEPLLYPSLITEYLTILKEYNFPFIELQTNGIALVKMKKLQYLEHWYDLGLTTISLSCAHYENMPNIDIFGEKWVDLVENIRLLHKCGFSIRLSCVMLRYFISNVEMVLRMVDFCRYNKVEQLTVRPVSNDVVLTDDDIENETQKYKIHHWVKSREIGRDEMADIDHFFYSKKESTLLLELAHGAKVYDYKGQNISVNSCLTHSPNPDKVRQLIFFPDGHLRYSWVHQGAIII